MSRRTIVAIAIAAAIGLLLFAALIAPRFINSTRLRDRIAAQLSEQAHATVQIAGLRIKLLPLPQVIAEQVSFSIPGVTSGTVESVAVVPELLALLKGSVQPASIDLVHPEVRVQLPSRPAGEAAASMTELKQSVAAALAVFGSDVAAQAPGLRLHVRDGDLQLSIGAAPLGFTGVQADVRLPPGDVQVQLACRSSFWERLTINASLDATKVAGRAAIEVSQLRLHRLPAELLPTAVANVGESEITATAEVTLAENGQVQATVDASLPTLRIHRDAPDAVVRVDHLGVTVALDSATTKIVARDWRFADPALRLSGELVLDGAGPRTSLQIQGETIDVAGVRRLALSLPGGTPVVHQLFNVLRGGQVTRLTIQSGGAALADLGDSDALIVRGHLADGEVHVPGVALDLRDVNGDAAVTGGVLAGEHIAAQLGHIKAGDGNLRLGLVGDSRVLQVDTRVDAEAAEVPPLLRRIAAGEWTKGLDHLSDVSGRASGTLHLAGTTQHPTASVETSELDVSARIESVREPVHARGGRLVYEGDAVTIRDLDVNVGASSLSHISGQVGWQEGAANFDLGANSSRLVLNELYPWLTATGWLGTSPWNPTALGGTIKVDSLRVRGPLASPSDWDVELVGAADSLDIESAQLRRRIALQYPVTLRKLRFVAAPRSGFSFAGTFAAPDGLDGAVDMAWTSDRFDIKRLAVRDAQSDAVLSLQVAPTGYDFALKGTLAKATVDALVPDNQLLGGAVTGDFRAHVVASQPTESGIEGHLAANDVKLSLAGGTTLHIAALKLDGHGGVVSVDAAVDDLRDSHVHVVGSVRTAPQTFVLDLDLGGDHIDWSEIQPLLARPAGDATPSGTPATPALPLRGTVRVNVDAFSYTRFTWKPVRAALTITPDGTRIQVSEANLCGIATPATITTTPTGLQLAVKLVAKNQQLQPATICLGAPDRTITGKYDLTGEISARGRAEEIIRTARGHIALKATAGRIYHMSATAKVLSAVNVATGALRDIGDLQKEGIAYTSVVANGEVTGGALALKEAVFDGPTLRAVTQGTIGLIDGALDLTLLVVPLKSVQSLMSYIPGFDAVVGQAGLVAIPVRVRGDLDNPQVTPLDPATVGGELLGVMTKTLKLPLKVIAPIWSGSTTK